MHDKLLNNLIQCIDKRKVPDWMTKGRIFFIQKIKPKEMLQVITGLLPAYHWFGN